MINPAENVLGPVMMKTLPSAGSAFARSAENLRVSS